MSSTNRGSVRSPNDYYKTDPAEIVRFLRHWCATDDEAREFWSKPRRILDPSAGGLTEEIMIPPKEKVLNDIRAYCKEKELPYPDGVEAQRMIREEGLVFEPSLMSYPAAINSAFTVSHTFSTFDIRENSRAGVKTDFLQFSDKVLFEEGFEMVITNPPFSLAIEFIKKSLRIVGPGGYVVMLLRLNFFGSEDRNAFFLGGHMPHFSYVHAKRLGFTPDGKTDSIEYCHSVWIKTDAPNYETKLRVLPY